MSASGGKADIPDTPHQCPLITHFGHQRLTYGPWRRSGSRPIFGVLHLPKRQGARLPRQEFAPNQVASSRRGYGVRWINLGEEIE